MVTTRQVGLWTVVAALFAQGCAPDSSRGEQDVAQTSAALTGKNGIWQNGLTTNGIWQNGIWQNGIWQNGIWQNGIWQNGIWQNGIWQNGVWEGNLDAREMLRTNPYAGKLLQYIYSCAMPAGATKVLDPAGAHVELTGSIGLAPTWDTEGGTCDESCQRWVSACVLARTNAYGENVDISMRAPETAPAHIKAALAVSPEEAAEFPLREGAFYGNLFATTPKNTAVPSDYSGPTDGAVINTPSFFACAGPGSNIPDITKRFCSSQGDQAVIKVPGICQASGASRGACDRMDQDTTRGAMQRCYTSTDPTLPRTAYQEVITVYLRDPIVTCGNGVCEATESDPEREAFCPSDCLPGWGESFASTLTGSSTLDDTDHTLFATGMRLSALDPGAADRPPGIVMAGVWADDLELGGGADFSCSWLPFSFNQGGVLVKLDSAGKCQWARRFGPMFKGYAGDVHVLADGSIVVMVHRVATQAGEPLLLTKFTSDGTQLWVKTFPTNQTLGAMAVSPSGDILLSSHFVSTISIGASTLTSAGSTDVFVTRLTPAGEPVWAVRLGGASQEFPTTVAFDRDGHALVGMYSAGAETGLYKLCGSQALCDPLGKEPGAKLWMRRGMHYAVTSDPVSGDVYAGGPLSVFYSPYDFVVPSDVGRGLFVARYAGSDGAIRSVRTVAARCFNCVGYYEPNEIVLDGNGSVLVGVRGGNGTTFEGERQDDEGIDFGAGLFKTYASRDVFIAAYSAADLSFQWAKHVPLVLDGLLRGMALDGQGRVVMSGTFTGSMLFDNRLLVNSVPETRGNVNMYLASFVPPALADELAPEQGHVPEQIVLEATSSAGAEAWFMPPTSIDAGLAGSTVTCDPPPSSTFPIGTTPVTCTATDPIGNHSTSSFGVTVRDSIAPLFTGVPPTGVKVQATSISGAIVNYQKPLAVDQINGNRPVSCSPSSGSFFAMGKTTVNCSTSDASGNQSATSFEVLVFDTPVLTLPGTIEAPATTTSGALVTYSASAMDGVDGAITPICTPPSGSTFPFGTTTVNCTATDSDGNTTSGSFDVKVPYPWSGFLQPIDADGSSIFKLGSTISVKFQLTGVAAGITNAVATLSVSKVSSAITGTDTEAISNSQATTGNTFRYDATGNQNQYVYNLSTKDLSVGTWRLSIDLRDGVSRTVLVSLKK